jgi:hypothetical protein
MCRDFFVVVIVFFLCNLYIQVIIHYLSSLVSILLFCYDHHRRLRFNYYIFLHYNVYKIFGIFIFLFSFIIFEHSIAAASTSYYLIFYSIYRFCCFFLGNAIHNLFVCVCAVLIVVIKFHDA